MNQATNSVANVHPASKAGNWQSLFMLVALFGFALLASPAFAQVGGAAGDGAATQARVMSIIGTWQGILFAAGAFAMAGAFSWVGWGMAFGGKQWKDVANVIYGACIAGGGSMLVGWLYM